MKSCEFSRKNLLLYAVTDKRSGGDDNFVERVRQALVGGVTMLQLREKNLPPEDFRRDALAVKALCEEFSVPFLINDDVALAKEIDADGAHIGQNDMTLAEARNILGADKIIGVSARTVEEALTAQKGGANYLGVGAVFATITKPDAQAVSLATLRDICAAVDIPVVAIGGIDKENIARLAGTGIVGVAVVSAIFSAADIRRSAAELYKTVNNTKFCGGTV